MLDGVEDGSVGSSDGAAHACLFFAERRDAVLQRPEPGKADVGYSTRGAPFETVIGILPLPSTVKDWQDRTSVTELPAGYSEPVKLNDLGEAEEPRLPETETTWTPSLPLRRAIV